MGSVQLMPSGWMIWWPLMRSKPCQLSTCAEENPVGAVGSYVLFLVPLTGGRPERLEENAAATRLFVSWGMDR